MFAQIALQSKVSKKVDEVGNHSLFLHAMTAYVHVKVQCLKLESKNNCSYIVCIQYCRIRTFSFFCMSMHPVYT